MIARINFGATNRVSATAAISSIRWSNRNGRGGSPFVGFGVRGAPAFATGGVSISCGGDGGSCEGIVQTKFVVEGGGWTGVSIVTAPPAGEQEPAAAR